MTNGAYGIPLAAPEIAALRKIAHKLGVVSAARRLGLSRGVVERGIAGLGIRRGSVALVRAALDRLSDEQERQP